MDEKAVRREEFLLIGRLFVLLLALDSVGERVVLKSYFACHRGFLC